VNNGINEIHVSLAIKRTDVERAVRNESINEHQCDNDIQISAAPNKNNNVTDLYGKTYEYIIISVMPFAYNFIK